MTTDLDEATLERLRVEGDQPAPLFEEERRCLLETCRQVLVRRVEPRLEEPRRFKTRRFCNHRCAMRHVHHQKRVGQPQQKTCLTCGAVFSWPVGMPLVQWKRKRHCDSVCGGSAPPRPGNEPRARHKPKTNAAAAIEALPVVERGPVWRPAGWSPTPNTWAGHRPPEQGVAS